MLDIKESYEWIEQHLQIDVGRFYGTAQGLSIGTGLLFDRIRYPVYNEEKNVFQTRKGLVYVLTHECDIDQNNIRPFNEDLLVCPIIKLEYFTKLFVEKYGGARLKEFLRNLALRNVSRLMYFPPLHEHLNYGGVIYFNFLGSTKVQAFALEEARKIGALSVFGLSEVDRMLQNHFFREKQQGLPLSVH